MNAVQDAPALLPAPNKAKGPKKPKANPAAASDPWSVKYDALTDPKAAAAHLAKLVGTLTDAQRKVAEAESAKFAEATNETHAALGVYAEALGQLREKTVSLHERLQLSGKALADAGLDPLKIRVILALWVNAAGFSASSVKKAMAALGAEDKRFVARKRKLMKAKGRGFDQANKVAAAVENAFGATLNFGFGDKPKPAAKGGSDPKGGGRGGKVPTLEEALAALEGEEGEKARAVVDALTKAGLVDKVASLIIQPR